MRATDLGDLHTFFSEKEVGVLTQTLIKSYARSVSTRVILNKIHGAKSATSSAGCLETCPSTGRRPTVYSWPAYDILALQMPIVERRVVCFPV